ncbi:MAG: RHS repeat-associated core domain-containing protein, partial [Gemmatimonadales bacterium]
AAVGDTAEFWVDRWGAPTKTRDPLGNVTVITRGDAANPALVTRVQTPDGRIVAAAYDSPRARLVWTRDSTYEGTGTTQVVTTSYVYPSASAPVPDSPTEVRTPVDTTKFAYDTALGLVDSVIAKGGHRTKFAYLTSGAFKGLVQSVTERQVRVVDTALWTRTNVDLATSFVYNGWGNDSIVTSPKGGQTRYERDAYQRVIRVRDPLSHVTEHFYDLLNRDTAVVVYDAVGLKTRYVYTPTGAVKSVIDPRAVTRSWAYDAGERPATMTDDLAVTETRHFGSSGLLDSLRTRLGHVIRHRYDAAGRQTATIYPAYNNTFTFPSGHDLVVPGDSLAWTYDAVGRPLTVSHFSSTVTFTYNKEGTVKTERQVVKDDNGQVVGDNTMRYWYDVGGRRTRFVNVSDTVFYTYGADARLSKLKVKWVGVPQPADSFFFFWDGLGRRDSLVYATPQVHVTMGYDKDGQLRLVCSKHLAPHQNALDRLEQRVRYTAVDGDGQPLSYRRYYGGTTSPACSATLPYAADIVDYTYDARHQLLTATGQTYAYDVSGNRIRAVGDSLVYVAGTNRVGWRYGETGNPPQMVLERTLHHDGNGSRTRDITGGGQGGSDSKLYYYNALGQQWAVKSYTGTQWVGPLGCRYDALGRQTKACALGLVGGRAAFDGDNVVLIGNSNWRFVHAPGVDDPLVGLYYRAPNFEKYFYLTDGRGRSLAFTDSIGNDYLGDVTYTQNGGNRAGAIDRSHTFANSRAETADAPGLSFYRNRYYDQTTGRWTQEDPIGIAGGVNLYSYVGNNPV